MLSILKGGGFSLRKLFYNNKMPTYAQLMEILKANKIRGYSHYTKTNLVDLLGERGLMPENLILVSKKNQRRI